MDREAIRKGLIKAGISESQIEIGEASLGTVERSWDQLDPIVRDALNFLLFSVRCR